MACHWEHGLRGAVVTPRAWVRVHGSWFGAEMALHCNQMHQAPHGATNLDRHLTLGQGPLHVESSCSAPARLYLDRRRPSPGPGELLQPGYILLLSCVQQPKSSGSWSSSGRHGTELVTSPDWLPENGAGHLNGQSLPAVKSSSRLGCTMYSKFPRDGLYWPCKCTTQRWAMAVMR